MMYNEFLNGTNCKDNEYNYKVFENLEVMYMNTNMSKEEIYEYGKKLVDNSKSQAEIELENKWKKQIENYKELIEMEKRDLEYRKIMGDNLMVAFCKKQIKEYKNRINEIKCCLNN